MKKDPNLSDNEKLGIMNSIFHSKIDSKYVKNVGDYISNSFAKIDGFDHRWTSLITSNPLLFEDVDYLRVRDYVDNQITQNEIDAYNRGELRELYATFENMLICNLQYYDRIMSYCTMIFFHYVRMDDKLVKHNLDRLTYELSLTPTRIWCAAMSSVNSTEWELNYAWQHNKKLKMVTLPIPGSDKTIIETSWGMLYRNPIFAKFNEYNALRCGTSGFRQTFISDKTSNRKLAQVCQKFTKTSVAISEQQLDTVIDYMQELESIKTPLYTILDSCLNVLFNGDSSQYCIYIFSNEFFIHTSKFSMKVSKSPSGIISKDYLANSYECFAAEEFLVKSIQTQIKWAKHNVSSQFHYDKTILKSLLSTMLETNFREITCVKRMNDYGIISKITFKGVYANVNIIEELMTNNRTIKSSFKTLSKRNAANYIVERGYYIFGTEIDVLKLLDNESITKQDITAHYNNYCVPVLSHMQDIIALHQFSKNDIIDVVVSGKLNPNKLNNHNIKYTSLSKIDAREIMSKGLKNQNNNLIINKKSYWRAIDE